MPLQFRLRSWRIARQLVARMITGYTEQGSSAFHPYSARVE